MKPSTDAGSLISDEELAQEAMAANPCDPDASNPFASDAVPFDDGVGDRIQLLPAWYMPAPSSSSATLVQKAAAVVCIGSLLAVTGAGLCTTYGIPELPLW